MPRNGLVALYGRLGMIVAAFALVAFVIAGPLLRKIWSSPVTVTDTLKEPAAPGASAAEKQS